MFEVTRTCGSCTACCKSVEVAELGKPGGQWCAHCEIGKGCSIYPNRPTSCRKFRCEWLKGLGTEEERPDIIKVIFDFVKVPDGPEKGQLQIFEVREGALDQESVRQRTSWAIANDIWVFHKPLHRNPTVFIPRCEAVSEATLERIRAQGMKILFAFSL